MQVLTQFQGLLLIFAYFAMMIGIVLLLKKRKQNKSEYLAAGHNAPWLATAFSMAATWVWAPSMFTAAEQAYKTGFAGVFWFVVPNVLTLILFAFFANRMRQLRPNGWTFSDYIREKYSNRTHTAYLVESFGLQICSMAVQLLAGAAIFHKITGLPFFWTTVLLAVVPLAYTFFTGIRSSIATDFVKMGFIVMVLLLGLPIMLNNTPAHCLYDGLGGITGGFRSLGGSNGLNVFLTFGLPTTIGLLSGTFGDQMFWQRTFAVEPNRVKRTMIVAAFVFAIVPISLSLFGFFVAGAGIHVEDTQLTNVTAVLNFTPRWFLYLFFLLILSGLISTVDSILCAVSSVAGHDVVERIKTSDKFESFSKTAFGKWLFAKELRIARLAMVVTLILAIGIANIPWMSITYLFLVYGTLRSSVMLPTIFAIKGVKMSEKGLFWGIVASLAIGLPLFAIGKLNNIVPLIVGGSLLTICLSGFMAMFVDRKNAYSAISEK